MKFDVSMTFDINATITKESLQRAILRAVKTTAFGFPGSCTIHYIVAEDDPLEGTTTLGPTGPIDPKFGVS